MPFLQKILRFACQRPVEFGMKIVSNRCGQCVVVIFCALASFFSHAQTYPTVDDAGRVAAVMATNRTEGCGLAIDVIGRCDWRGAGRITNLTEMVVSEVFANVCCIVAFTNDMAQFEDALSLRNSVVDVAERRRNGKHMLLTSNAVWSVGFAIGETVPYPIQSLAEMLETQYRIAHTNDLEGSAVLELSPYSRELHRYRNLNVIKKTYRGRLVNSAKNLIRMYGESLDAGERAGFEEQFTQTAGLTDGERAQIFGDTN